jgi:hypothetical protein
MRDWKPVSEDEMHVVLAIFMRMGIVQKSTAQLYILKNSAFAIPVFGCVISMDRFETICKFMQFNKNDSKYIVLGSPEHLKIYPVMSYLNRKFQTSYMYIPDQNARTDEFLTLWRGRLSF